MANIEPVEECFGTYAFWGTDFNIKVREGAVPRYKNWMGDFMYSSVDCNGDPKDFRRAAKSALSLEKANSQPGLYQPIDPVEYARDLRRQHIGGRQLDPADNALDYAKRYAEERDRMIVAKIKHQREMQRQRAQKIAVDIEVCANDLVPKGQAYVIGQSLAMLNPGDMVKIQGILHDSVWFDEAAAFKSLKELPGTKTGRYSSGATNADLHGRPPLPGWKGPKIRTPFDPFAGSGFKVESGWRAVDGSYTTMSTEIPED